MALFGKQPLKRKRENEMPPPPIPPLSKQQSSFDFTKVPIKVIVGRSRARYFHVHEELLTSRSEYFRRALGRDWFESSQRQIRLEEQESGAFVIYLTWLYRSKFTEQKHYPVEGTRAGYSQLTQAYTLGEYIQDITFKNAVIDALLKERDFRSPNAPAADVVRHAYKHTPENSKLRALFVQLYIQSRGSVPLGSRTNPDDFPPEFLRDLAAALLKENGSRHGSGVIDPRQYHELRQDGVAVPVGHSSDVITWG